MTADLLAIVPSARRFQAVFAGVVVVDSTRGALLYERGLPPVLYVPKEDVRLDLLEPSERETPWPGRGDARHHSLRVEDRVAIDAAWEHPVPPAEGLRDRMAFCWDAMDAWFEEDAPAYGHMRDPFHRVDVLASSRHVCVELDGATLAETRRPRLLFETGLPVRTYVPPVDVRTDLLTPAEGHSICPYKGVASYLTATIDGVAYEKVAWTYPAPHVECTEIESLICFDDERVGVLVDGAAQTARPWGSP